MEPTKKHPTIGKYILLKTLGCGYNSKVKLGFDSTNNGYCAVKMIKHDHPTLNVKSLEKEIAVMQNLSHPNIVNLIDFIPSEDYHKKNGTTYKVLAIVMELVPGGELFEYVADSGRFSEAVARSYFQQLIETLEYCHHRGIAHRDLKPENLLFDAYFNLKIADFGFATLICGSEGDGKLLTYLGTVAYMAPELHAHKAYNGPSVDLFACAIILFIMLSGTPPFAQGEPKDPHYKLLCTNAQERFWNAHSRGKLPGFYSADFKSLFSSMVDLDPAKRLSISDIKAHPWYNGPAVDVKTLQKEFADRKKKVDEELKRQKEAKDKQKEKDKVGAAFKGFKPFQGRSLESEMGDHISKINFKESLHMDSPRVCREYVSYGAFKAHTESFFLIQPDILFKYLVSLAQNVFTELTVSTDTYKLKGRYLGDIHRFDTTIELYKVDEQTTCIQFTKKSGVAVEYYKMIDETFKKPIDALVNKVTAETKAAEAKEVELITEKIEDIVV